MSTKDFDTLQQTPETPGDQSHSQQQDISPAESQAAHILAQSEAAAASPEAEAPVITEKYLKSIPEEDRDLRDPRQLKTVLFCLKSAVTRGDLTSTRDKLGNLPRSIVDSFVDSLQPDSANKPLEAIRRFAENPLGGAQETDKIRSIATSALPESVKQATLHIIMDEGPHSAQNAFRVLGQRVEEQGLTDAEGIYKVIHEIRDDPSLVSRDSDGIRREALQSFLEGIYPGVMQGRPVEALKKLWNTPDDIESRDPRLESLLSEGAEILKNHTFTEEYDELGETQTIEGLITSVSDGSLSPLDAKMILERELEAHLMGMTEAEGGFRAVEAEKSGIANNEIGTTVESQERRDLKGVRYIHVEDDEYLAPMIQDDFSRKIELPDALGTARSVASAGRLVQSMVDSGKPLNLVVLDKSFMFGDDDDIPDSGAWKRFMKNFETAAQDPRTKDVLGGTKVVIMSGDISPDELKEMQGKYPRIIGALEKGSEDNSITLAGLLAQADVVSREGKALEGYSHIQRKSAAADFEAGLSRTLLRRLSGDDSAEAQQEVLALVNTQREKLGMTPTDITSDAFAKLRKALESKATDFYSHLNPDQIFSE
jgi:hypothetical protein